MHKAVLEGMASEDAQALMGQLAFVNAIESDFVSGLLAKYDLSSISQIRLFSEL